jgi:Glycosyl transferases group 1
MATDALRVSAVLPAPWIRVGHATCVAVARIAHRIAALVGPGRTSRRGAHPRPMLCMEGGPAGWAIIELVELAASAEEYLGAGSVHRLVIPSRDVYLRTVRETMDAVRPTHYLYDPRTGSQEWFTGAWEAFRVGLMAARRGIVPIGWLTDLPIRSWRLQVAIATAAAGVTMTLMNAPQVARLFAHRRLSGPSIMPLSEATLETLEATRARYEAAPAVEPRAVFTGSLYEPRTTALVTIRDGLRAQGLELEILSRELGGPRVPNETYWERLAIADIVVTTADQVFGAGIDDTGLPHLIYRYTEALAAGALLVAPAVPAIERYFTPWEHFVPFDGADDAIALIARMLGDRESRQRIARAGHARAASLIRARSCWLAIDAALGTESLT